MMSHIGLRSAILKPHIHLSLLELEVTKFGAVEATDWSDWEQTMVATRSTTKANPALESFLLQMEL